MGTIENIEARLTAVEREIANLRARAESTSQAALDVHAERAHQISLGYDAEHDDEHDDGALVRAAISRAAVVRVKLVEAAALLIAEIERAAAKAGA